MRVVMFYHSLISDWNHGNAHFLRGVVSELMDRGHDVVVLEPHDAWSVAQLMEDAGPSALDGFHRAYPRLTSVRYDARDPELDEVLDGADLVLVHEWNEHDLVARIGSHRAASRGYRLFFHDTHHRCVTEPAAMARYDLRDYDGVLAFGAVIADEYRRHGWADNVWVWHEAADVRVFRPLEAENAGDLVWIGNWGDDERAAELHEMLIEPVRDLELRARIHGVRYPSEALRALADASIEYGGWLPNHEVPRTFAAFCVTVHVPRGPYVHALPGIPTIRVFEALACGIPLISAPWEDVEELFTPGADFLVARNGVAMKRHLRAVLSDADLSSALREHGLRTIHQRHTCVHRVDELLHVMASLTPALTASGSSQ